MKSLSISRSSTPKDIPTPDNLGFGRLFSDHMLVMDYNQEQGWHHPRIEPYAPFCVEPAMMVFHYGQAIFEGMKAFRQQDGGIAVFRPLDHFRRFNHSADRLCIPRLDPGELLAFLRELLRLDQQWVPDAQGTALYIRPFVIATDNFLGVRPSNTYRFFIILSPVGAYYAEGFNPVKILVEDEYVRAAQGGIGDIKAPGNYAASLLAARKAQQEGYTQVLWLDAKELKMLEEVGTMNIMVKIRGKVYTPPLTGSILPGITRQSVLTILHEWGIPAVEESLSIDELMAAAASGDLEEMFGTGTAAVISPVGKLRYRDQELLINDGRVGELSQRLFDHITGIQYGLLPDTHGWLEKVAVD
ncbi:MAG: branched-chain amino acid aminotransferase [Deltaproteobacteria bacterium]|nr:branched-chain amino acid aminotransferase [Deltaproteobacteria bacterium]